MSGAILAAIKDGKTRTGWEWTTLGWNECAREIARKLRIRADIECGHNQYALKIVTELYEEIEREYGVTP